MVSGSETTTGFTKLRIGVSSCLVGHLVRYNGGHVKNKTVDALGVYVDWVPLCPEFEIGMGVPREAIRLVRDGESVRLVAPRSGTDYTEAMESWSQKTVREMDFEGLDGYILKRDSPSCGLYGVRVYRQSGGSPERNGRGVFARALTEAYPDLPVEEEGRLNDPRIKESFIERIFARKRWRETVLNPGRPRDLVAFHSSYKLVFMAHNQEGAKRLGRIVASVRDRPLHEALAGYAQEMMSVLSRPATAKRHANALQHAAGFLKDSIDSDDRQELAQTIDDYRRGLVPLIVPITLLRHHVRKAEVAEWLSNQVYLDPYPGELMIRNQV